MQPVLRATLVSAESLVASEQFVRVEIVQYVLLVGLVSVKIFVPVELPFEPVEPFVLSVDDVRSVVVVLLVASEQFVSAERFLFLGADRVVGMGPLVSLDLVKSGLTVAPPVSTERFLSKEPPVSVGFV
ncbi:hypothetical protein PF010_g31423 [Phytophthora fragariae]|uniref:Uncharacterized protein n=1 Tax=Phytophthora fragariae TaxID=53985 RepID=A0A6G0MAK0_9STRA|nr:hypothetical protein PF010_g31423 [Phytophthora fragariae]KAE9160859.1 hypothetical protein PF004_g31028 [Phytophthora fragariae]